MTLRLVVVVCSLVAFACRKGADTSTHGEPGARAGASVRVAPDKAPPPLTEEDFEEEAARQINVENIDAELTLIEQEIRQGRAAPEPSAAPP